MSGGRMLWACRRRYWPALHKWEILVRVQKKEEAVRTAIHPKDLLEAHPEAQSEAAAGVTVWEEDWDSWWTARMESWRKWDRRDMKELQRRQKCAPSRISFMKMSAGLTLPETWQTWSILSWTHLRTEFSQSSMCRAALEVILYDPMTHAALSLYMIVGELISGIDRPESATLWQRLRKLTTFLEVSHIAGISASRELRDVRAWHSLTHPIEPPFLKTMPPLMLQHLKIGSNVPSATELPSCEPQQASLYAEIVSDRPKVGGTASL